VLRISVVSIALAILVNSLTLAIVRGFQQKIKDKISEVWGVKKNVETVL
jgi:ABC-type lipoprotein release transport system permease subunit